jgi:[acyl-carrier-protein] S-malonyltransferase
VCSVANLNAPGQVVVAGEVKALDVLESIAKDHGVRRTRRLVVAGGFHSECMRPAADRLARALSEVVIRAPRIPFVTNVTGEPVSDPVRIRENLAQQVCAPVLWEKSMRWAVAQGITRFVEPAPGKVLAGLLGKIAPEVQTRSLAAPADLNS